MEVTDRLRVALLVYRGNPYSGGQGVYTRYLSRELVALGHTVDVFAGPPYPELDPGVGFVPVPSLDLYREPDPFRLVRPSELTSAIDLLELGIMLTAGFPEPLAFSLRVRRALARRRGEYDIVHDNQGLGRGMLGVLDDGWPLLTTIHHPITVDRSLDLTHAGSRWRRTTLRRWYGFVGMQREVAASVPRVVTVSESSASDLVEAMGVPGERIGVVPVGVDTDVFRPLDGVERVPGRIVTTASADVPLKGLVPLLEAVAKLRTERNVELVVVGKPRQDSALPATLDRLGLGAAVRFRSKLSQEEIVSLYAEAAVAVVPSLYEGFSLPAIEAMACGVPLVATTGGALPEVVGPSGEAGLLVAPGDPSALAGAIGRVLDEPGTARRLGAAGLARVRERFTWAACAAGTVREYRGLLDAGAGARVDAGAPVDAGAAAGAGARVGARP